LSAVDVYELKCSQKVARAHIQGDVANLQQCAMNKHDIYDMKVIKKSV